jgi:hypothetical protein
MNMNISREWLLRMAEREGNGIISVGGLVCRMNSETGDPTVTPDPGREHMMEPRPPRTLGPPEAAECERCGEPAERRARFWRPLVGDEKPGNTEFDDFDLCDTCWLLWMRDSDRTPEEFMAFWENYDDGRDE